MFVRVLGGVGIDDMPLHPRERTMLAALVLRHGTAVSAAGLADAYWGDSPPSTWPKQVQAAIGRLRSALGRDAIETSPTGYILGIPADATDLGAFEESVRSGRTHLAEGDPERAVIPFQRALDQWRGPAFPDLARWADARGDIARLEEMRLAAEEDLQSAHLDCGEHRSAVAQLEQLVREQPLRERRWALLALAQYRSDRQADALATIRAARRRFDEEIGVDPGEGLEELQSRILRQDLSLRPAPTPPRGSPRCPYHGLEAFGSDDKDDFFGRDADIAGILARLDDRPLLALTGPSGCGKSSVVLSGVVPILRRRGVQVTVGSPAADAGALLAKSNSLSGESASVVVIDQFEEAFHAGDGRETSAALGAALARHVARGGRVVLVVRSDYLDECAADPSLGPLLTESVHVLRPLDREDLRQVIERPAHAAGLRIEAGLTELMLRDAAGTPGALPHLSHALVETWTRREGRVLTVEGYLGAGGIRGAIAQSAEHLYALMDERQRELCRSTMKRLIDLDADANPVRRRVAVRPLREDADRDHVLALLTRARLLSAEGDTVMVAHESIAEAWPRLRGWLEEDAEGTRVMAGLAGAAQAWHAGGRPDDELYGSTRLQAALDWRERAAPDLTPVEADFLDASADRADVALRTAREREQRERRQNRRLRGALAAVATLLVVTVTAAAFAGISADTAQRSARDAQIEGLASTVRAVVDSDRDTGALLAAEMYRRWPDDPRTRAALMTVMTAAGGYLGRVFVDAHEISGALIPDTRTAFVVADAGAAWIIDVDTGRVVSTIATDLPGTRAAVRGSLTLAADGSTAVWTRRGESGVEVAVLDLVTATQRGPVATLPDGLIDRPAVSEDGASVWFVDAVNGDLVTWDASSGALSRTATLAPTDADAWVSPPAAVGGLIVLSSRTELIVVDPVAQRVVRRHPVPEGAGGGNLVAVGDGTVLTVDDGALARVRVDDGAVLWTAPFGSARLAPCWWMVAAPQRDSAYCADDVGAIREIDLGTGAETGREFDAQVGASGDLAVTGDGAELIVVGADSPSVARWRLDGGGPASRLVARDREPAFFFEPQGDRILALCCSGFTPSPAQEDAAMWRPATGERLDIGGRGWIAPGLVYDLDGDTVIVREAEGNGTWRWSTASRWGDLPVYDIVAGSASGLTYASVDPTEIRRSGDETPTIVQRIDPRTGKDAGPALSFGGQFYNLWDTPDGSRVLVRYADWATGRLRIAVFDGGAGTVIADGIEDVTGAVITPDGDRVIAATHSGLRVYSLPDLDEIAAFDRARTAGPRLTLSSDGRTLLVPSWDGTVSLWDVPSGRRLGVAIAARIGPSITGYLQPDGAGFVVNGPEGLVWWTLDPADHVRAACEMAGRELTRDEWATYFPDDRQTATCSSATRS